MKYMFLMYGAESCWTDDERRACMVESLAICDELAAGGKFIDASPLQSVTTAKTVRVRDGHTLVTDGPVWQSGVVTTGSLIVNARLLTVEVQLFPSISNV